ncbi:MAG: SDR family oxidoreductase [Myxococcales bacterium]|nr:SDR family oxidoreductase [Myxococcales bacterium]
MSRDLEGKTFMVTGATSGVGLVTVQQLAARGAYVVLAVRSASKAAPVVEELRSKGGACEVLAVDVSDLSSVRTAADQYLASGRALDVLVNNAGMAGQRGLSKDGFELTFATNHLGHFLLTEKLLPLLKASAQGRLVNVSSEAHYRPKGIDWDALRKPTSSTTGMAEYGVSKLCNVLHAAELARRVEGTKITTYSLHPGVVATDVWRSIPSPFAWLMKRFMLTAEEGARTQIKCATDPALASETGLYYDKERTREPSKISKDPALARELWTRSEAWVAPFLR